MNHEQDQSHFRAFVLSCFRDGIGWNGLSRWLLSSSLVLLLAGCGGKQEPVRAYGQPIAHWLAELKKPESKARKKAVVALGQIGPADPQAIPALIGALKDPEVAVKEKAILALLQIGPAARDAIPALTEAQKDAEPAIRAAAKKTIQRIKAGEP